MDSKKRQDLKALLTVLRNNGVLRFKMEGLELELSPESSTIKEASTSKAVDMSAAPDDGKWSGFPTGTLSPEQLAYYSAGGNPDEDPYREGGEA